MRSVQLFLMVLISFSSTAFCCESYDMLFFGLVRNVTADCTYQIEVTQSWPNDQCPLVPGEVSAEFYKDPACSLKNGDKITGLASKVSNEILIQRDN